jgi:hypothetical protein
MTATRVALFLACSLFALDLLHAEDEKGGKGAVPRVNVEDLRKDPEKYHRQVVQVEGTLAEDPVGPRTPALHYYLRLAEADGLAITCHIPPGASKGDRVLVTGAFRYGPNPSGGVTLELTVDKQVEKLPPGKK